MSFLPIFFGLEQKFILIIGGGKIALAKLETIFEYTDRVTVISDNFDQELLNFTKENNIAIIQDKYNEKYLSDFDIIIATTNDFTLNQQISKDAKKIKKIVNIVDNAAISDFIFGSIVQRNDLNIAIGSGGLSPVLTRIIKQKIEKILPENLSDLNDFIRKNRQTVKNKLKNIQSRRLFWQEFLEGNIAEEVLIGNFKNAQNLFDQKLFKKNNSLESALYLIGAGAGDPDLLTLKAVKLLSKADIVLYDRLVADPILDYARKDALKINVGKRKDFHKYSQAEINQLIEKYLKEGNIVVRLKGGDPAIFAHMFEEIDVAKKLDISYQIIPGISAISAAAAYNSIPLTARDIAQGLRILTLYKKDLENEQYWQDLAKSSDTLAFYMSSSNAKYIADQLIKYGKNPKIKIAVIEQASTKYQQSYISNLEDFEQREFISPSLIIIGDVVKFSEEYGYLEKRESENYFREIYG
jgi:uroporphyrin-III C-methyltransferase / precorrin-2 dehydrogenase / sirohydrochlorin ferrochelatase